MKKLLITAIFLALPALACAESASQPSDTLARVQESQVLRVCTPGDYRPFSFLEDSGKYVGLDIDMVKNLADTLDADVKFVKTTWGDLMEDFTSGMCDIAVGGISVNLDRQKHAYFSDPYMVNGKTPITLCSNVDKYQTIADINQPDVRVIYNPGGSNEAFATTRLANAHLTEFDNNIGIFDQVAKGKADVFVTETAEALVQSKLNPSLCAVHPDKPLKYGEMAFLLPEGDMRFKLYVDQWLHLLKASGAYAKIAGEWIPQ